MYVYIYIYINTYPIITLLEPKRVRIYYRPVEPSNLCLRGFDRLYVYIYIYISRCIYIYIYTHINVVIHYADRSLWFTLLEPKWGVCVSRRLSLLLILISIVVLLLVMLIIIMILVILIIPLFLSQSGASASASALFVIIVIHNTVISDSSTKNCYRL